MQLRQSFRICFLFILSVERRDGRGILPLYSLASSSSRPTIDATTTLFHFYFRFYLCPVLGNKQWLASNG